MKGEQGSERAGLEYLDDGLNGELVDSHGEY